MVVTMSDPLEVLVEVCDDEVVAVVDMKVVVVCVVECDLEIDVDVDVGASVEVELVSVMVTVVTTTVLWEVVCDGACEAVVEPLSALVVMGIVGGSRTWPPGTCEDPFPPSALVATTSEPAAASTTSVNTDTSDSF